MATTSRTDAWFDELWPRVLVSSGVGYLATSYAVSRWLTRRSPAKIEWPTRLAHLKMEALSVGTSDGIRLRGWVVEPPQPRATVALFHGLRGNRTDTIGRIEVLTAAGYRCVAFDLRAHGESGGSLTSFGYFERRDIKAVASLIQARWPREPRAVIGLSMGGAAVCFAGEVSRAFDAIILESVYHELVCAFQHRVGCGFPSWFKHFREGIIWLTESRFGVTIDRVSPLAHIARLMPRPILLITGSDDPHAPPSEMRLLAERVRETGRFHVIAGAGHEDVFERGGAEYRDLIVSFLERQLFANRQPTSA